MVWEGPVRVGAAPQRNSAVAHGGFDGCAVAEPVRRGSRRPFRAHLRPGALQEGLYNPSVRPPAQAGAGNPAHASAHSVSSVSVRPTLASSRRA